MHHLLDSAYDRHLVSSFDKQLRLNDLIGTSAWTVDVSAGYLSFTNGVTLRSQFLGTESYVTDTWRWAWANEGSDIPVRALQASLSMLKWGRSAEIPELLTPIFSRNVIGGEALTMIASGICHAKAFFRAPYDGGAVFILVDDENFPEFSGPILPRIVSVFTEVISTIEIPNHRDALLSYVDYYQLQIGPSDHDSSVNVRDRDGNSLIANFDELERLSQFHLAINTP